MEKKDPRTVVAIILGGGAGTRLFPLTKRRAKPAVRLCHSSSHQLFSHLFTSNKNEAKLLKNRAYNFSGLGSINDYMVLNFAFSTRQISRSSLVKAPNLTFFTFQVPIGGAYRLIDVPMSNCINCGINKVYILTQFNSASLNRHLARAYNFGSGVTFGDGYTEVRILKSSTFLPHPFKVL